LAAGEPRWVDPRGVAAGLVTALSWGATGLWVRLLPSVSPLLVTAMRLSVAGVVLCGVGLWRGPARGAIAARRRTTFGLGALLVGYYSLAVAAYQLAGVAEVTLCITSSPILVLLWSVIRGNGVRRHEVLAVCLGTLGLVVLLEPWTVGSANSSGRLLGLGCAALGTVVTTVYVLWSRALALEAPGSVPPPDGIEVGRRTFLPAALVLALVDQVISSRFAAPWPSTAAALLTPGSVAALLALGVVSTALPTWSFAVATQRTTPVLATTLRLTTPIFAALYGIAFLHEAVGLNAIVGAVFVLGSCALLIDW
jgi:drug/metabolite transporter (DMT)-like permease